MLVTNWCACLTYGGAVRHAVIGWALFASFLLIYFCGLLRWIIKGENECRYEKADNQAQRRAVSPDESERALLYSRPGSAVAFFGRVARPLMLINARSPPTASSRREITRSISPPSSSFSEDLPLRTSCHLRGGAVPLPLCITRIPTGRSRTRRSRDYPHKRGNYIRTSDAAAEAEAPGSSCSDLANKVGSACCRGWMCQTE
jgi:hypothetical protein